jgi:hypothetical protein
MIQKIAFWAVIAFIIVFLLGLAAGYRLRSRITLLPTPSPTPITTTTTIPTKTVDVTGSTTGPGSSVSPTVDNRPNISVFSPRANDKVGASFAVTGEARVFENQFHMRVTNSATKEVLFDESENSNASDVGQFGKFSVPINLDNSNLRQGDKLLLEVFQFSAKDGSEVDKVSVPLVF